jgi:hypothetical protein
MGNQYYNAKPSSLSNIGADIAGAKRMHFDTYETDAEREVKERRKNVDKCLKVIKEEFKAEILKDAPSSTELESLINQQFFTQYGFDNNSADKNAVIEHRRSVAGTRDERSEFNKMVRAYNNLRRDLRDLGHHYRIQYYIAKMKRKYAPKQSFTESSGVFHQWKDFEPSQVDITQVIDGLKLYSRAVQFGNSVTDKERGHILVKLSEFIQTWKENEMLNRIDLSPIGWSFGARGKAGSVAYFQSGTNVISVNRNNIGSLVHEVGHYLDYSTGKVSNGITYETVSKYAESLPKDMDRKSTRYYCKREEIFARAFEAYCFKYYMGFDKFAQCGKAYLPELNDNLIAVIEKALG